MPLTFLLAKSMYCPQILPFFDQVKSMSSEASEKMESEWESECVSISNLVGHPSPVAKKCGLLPWTNNWCNSMTTKVILVRAQRPHQPCTSAGIIASLSLLPVWVPVPAHSPRCVWVRCALPCCSHPWPDTVCSHCQKPPGIAEWQSLAVAVVPPTAGQSPTDSASVFAQNNAVFVGYQEHLNSCTSIGI